MTPEEAEGLLIEWAGVTRDRDNRVRAAVDVGVSKYRVHQLTGIGRSTIDRILAARVRPLGPSMAHLEAGMITDTNQGACTLAQTPWSGAEARGFEPRMGANPNRISSAAP